MKFIDKVSQGEVYPYAEVSDENWDKLLACTTEDEVLELLEPGFMTDKEVAGLYNTMNDNFSFDADLFVGPGFKPIAYAMNLLKDEQKNRDLI